MAELKKSNSVKEEKSENIINTCDEIPLQGIAVASDCCNEKYKEVTFDECEDIKDITVQDLSLKCTGRLLKVRVKLDRVCAGRKITLGVFVRENTNGTFITKGFRAYEFTVPGTPGTCVDNVNVNEFCFVFPEEKICCPRSFKVNVIAHYSSFRSFSL